MNASSSKTQKKHHLRVANDIPSIEALIKEDQALLKTELIEFRNHIKQYRQGLL